MLNETFLASSGWKDVNALLSYITVLLLIECGTYRALDVIAPAGVNTSPAHDHYRHSHDTTPVQHDAVFHTGMSDMCLDNLRRSLIDLIAFTNNSCPIQYGVTSPIWTVNILSIELSIRDELVSVDIGPLKQYSINITA